MTQIRKHQINNHELTGASFISSIGIYDETKNYSAGEIILWQAKQYKAVNNITGTDEGDLSKSPDIDTVNWTENKEEIIFSVFPSTAQSFTGSRITVAFDNTDMTSPFATLNADNSITINHNAVLIVSVTLSTRVSSGTDRSGSIGYLQIDSGAGYSDVPTFEIDLYNRDLNTGRNTGHQTIPIKFGTGDRIRLQVYRYDGTSTIETIPEGCYIVLFNSKGMQGTKGADGDITWEGTWQNQDYLKNQAVEYNGSAYVCIRDTISKEIPTNTTYWNLMVSKGDQGDTGPTGPSGDLVWRGSYNSSYTYDKHDTVESNGSCYTCLVNNLSADEPPSVNWDLVASRGDDGSGASITIRNNNVNIPNTPHSVLNFTGNISANDSGSGVATIEVPVSPFVVSYGMSGTEVVDASSRAVKFDSIISPDSAVSLNTSTGRITFNKDVKILVSYNIFMTLDSGDTARNTITAWIEINGTKVDYSQTAAYTRGYNYNKYGNCSCPQTFLSVSNGDYLDVIYIRDDDINTPVIGSSQTWITIQEVK